MLGQGFCLLALAAGTGRFDFEHVANVAELGVWVLLRVPVNRGERGHGVTGSELSLCLGEEFGLAGKQVHVFA